MDWRTTTVIAGLLLASSAHAQSIYKCPQPNGTWAYTDIPCSGPGGKLIQRAASTETGARAGDITSASTPAQLAGMSLNGLYYRLVALGKRSHQLRADMQRDIDTRLGTHARDASARAEVARIRATWQPKLRAVEAEQQRINDEIRRRCPHGSALNGGSMQVCNK